MNPESLPFDPARFSFAPVVTYDGEWYVFDFSMGYDPGLIRREKWGIGRYNEKRRGMYVAPQYQNRRNIHVGIDFWTPAGVPVCAFFEGEIAYLADNARPGDYGPTVVTRHSLDGAVLFALHGHLARASLDRLEKGQEIKKGQEFAEVGAHRENGGWEPHLHFQLSVEDPGRADMPGVVAEENIETALEKYPDPRLIVGDIY
ncbi:peptidoglycan DD-metalloendopeptidase family protein [Halalkalibaculum sp. DA384]|uniref:peptidoglycan DD-metalloendopeptidase family protein n=1 Tax=Halalkalibaculum sp. DA384 TaxID=3373606 RepID=UPI00375499F1